MALTQVKTAGIAADAVTGAKIADDAINSEHYVDGSIDNAHVADDQINSEHYAAASIDEAHLADDAVSLAKMAPLARGRLIVGDDGGNPSALAIGTDNYVLTSDGTDVGWEAAAGGGVDGITSSANATAITIDSDERVMIGTSSAQNADSMLTIAETSGHCEVNILAKNDSGAVLNFGDPEDYNIGRMKYDHSANEFIWDVNNTHRLSLESGGDLNIEDGNLKVASGHGIDFSATANGGTSTPSELLDDYEEGTFTPTWDSGLSSIGYTHQLGSYTKIGNTVFFYLYLLTASGTTGSAALVIGGLPYNNDTSNPQGGAYVTLSNNMFDGKFIELYLTSNVINFYEYDNTNLTSSEASPIGKNLVLQGFYRV